MAGDDAEADGEPVAGGSDDTDAGEPPTDPATPDDGVTVGDVDSDAVDARAPLAGDLEPAVRRVDDGPTDDSPGVGEYTWVDYLDEYGPDGAAERVQENRERARREEAKREAEAADDERVEVTPPYPAWDELDADPPQPDWDAVDADPADDLGFEPEARHDVVGDAVERASDLHAYFDAFTDPATTPVVKDEWLWEHFKREHYYVGENDWTHPRDDDGEVIPFDPAKYLGFDPDDAAGWLSLKEDAATETRELVDERTVDVREDVDEDAFFSTVDGRTTLANRYDLEKAVPIPKKAHFREVERYWVNKPYAFVVIFHSDRENEKKYYLVEPYRNPIERDLQEFLTGKLRTAIKYASDDVAAAADQPQRRQVIERETRKLLDRYDLFDDPTATEQSLLDRVLVALGGRDPPEEAASDGDRLEGLAARPEPAVLDEDPDTLTEYQVETLLYTLQRDFVGYERIDGVKHDINVEDVSCDGYDSPVFVYHTDYENLITNVQHGRESLDDFVVKLAQRSGKGISKRQPQVDATLPDGSRAQLTLGQEVSDHGTNYTIRQFKDVPFTPVDLVNWQTFSLDEMAFLWLAIESHKSIVFAGGTASGKTTSLNAVSLFIPSNTKIVSIEDTREVELPQRNWIASVTRPSFGEDESGDIDEFDLLEAALRQRPDYIVMGEVRGEEGRTLFQVMSTGHTTYTTFHADNVGEVLKRFTTEPINVSKTLFTALDLVSVQSQTRVRGQKVRRNRSITEINRYDAENDEINVNDVFQWEPEDDSYRQTADSSTLDEIRFDRGWTHRELERQLDERRVLLAYLIVEGLNEYAQVAATAQAYINDPDTILTLVANDQLQEALEDLRGMESVLIDVDPEKEEMVPRPDPSEGVLEEAEGILETAREDGGVLAEFEGETPDSLASALTTDPADDVVAERTSDGDLESAIERVAHGDGFDEFDADGADEAADGGTALADDGVLGDDAPSEDDAE
ncbi:type II/IV secretion system ATPase subunit [Halobacterium litoreum]|uniref:Type II/IV secretion system ATPase subunit n=1 Tax=Halobacterium litoreum TaxID=2039234 RepID=A0ABD5NIB6_9EURY|nr:type II/IV secretion system ATPase subunit [Halobacterium litoreum]UHH12145.1 type II/IV secretion system ATPase subunit [Halobacterium litoreum]